MHATDIAVNIERAWAAFLERDQRPTTPHPYVYASSWRPCLRRTCLEMQGAPIPPWPADVLARFRRGDDRERDLLADLTRIGRDADPAFSVIGQQERFTLKDRKGRPAIVGKVDARIQVAGLRAPLEVKAWAPHIVRSIDTFADLFVNPWTRSGGYQLLSYLFGAEEPVGFMLLDRAGLPKLLPVVLDEHLDHVEAFLVLAERALDHLDAGTLPPYLEDDPQECQRCSFYGDVCNPPLVHEAAVVLTDPQLEAALARREELKDAAREFEAWDTDIKKRLRGVEAGVCGQFEIRGTWSASSRVELPPDIRKQFTVRDAHGRFTLEIVRHTP